MSQETEGDAALVGSAAPQAAGCQSPPPAPIPASDATPDPRVRLLQLAGELMRSHNRRLVVEYLRLRRTVA